MDYKDIYYDRLKELVEKRFERKLCTHSDFTELAEMIYDSNKEVISPTTLKRFWGYLKQEHPTPQIRTLNALAKFIQHNDWQEFCNYQEKMDSYSSEYVKHDTLHSFLLKPQVMVDICWYPDRRVRLRHEDNDLFTVVESINSKLQPGMMVHCETFTSKEPLWLKNVRGEMIEESCDYICGKIGGIEYNVVSENR